MSSASSAGSQQAAHLNSVFALVAAGAIAIVLADVAPSLVNGLLVLVLAGVIFHNQAAWGPALTSLANNLGSNKVRQS